MYQVQAIPRDSHAFEQQDGRRIRATPGQSGLRVLLLSRYDRLGSSSRLRHYQFLPFLEEHGIQVDVHPLLPNTYLSKLYFERSKPLQLIVRAYLKRIFRCMRSHEYDLIWIEKEMLPWLPYAVERGLLAFGPPYIVDFDDAWFHTYGRHRLAPVRRLLGNKLNLLMRNAALVTTGNPYLLSHALRAGAPRVALMPTVIDLARYAIPPAKPADSDFTIGWIGSPVTSRYLDLVQDTLQQCLDAGRTRIVLVGADSEALSTLPVERVGWNEESEVDSIMSFDVGIMPLDNTPWERGKCGYKLIQYMACGRPILASPVGVNRDIVEHGVNGFLCDTPEEWLQALTLLCRNPELRRSMGEAGRAKVEQLYTLDKIGPKLVEHLRTAAESGRATKTT